MQLKTVLKCLSLLCCVLIGMVYFVLEPTLSAEIIQLSPVKISDDKNQYIDIASASAIPPAEPTRPEIIQLTPVKISDDKNQYIDIASASAIPPAEPTRPEIIQLTPVKISEDKNQYIDIASASATSNTSISSTFEYSDGWKIIYNEQILRDEVTHIHNSHYNVRYEDKCTKSNPDFILVGVSKCGTKELIDFLSIHPNIITKTHPYQVHLGRETVIDKMPCKYHDQLAGFKLDTGLRDHFMPDEIYKVSPNMKIMIIVREPVSRLLSHLSFIPTAKTKKVMQKKTDVEGDLKQVINETVYNNNPDSRVQLSTYDLGLESYLKRFKQDQILVIESSEFQKNPVGVLGAVERFLGLPSFISDKHFAFNSKKQFYCIRKAFTTPRTMVCYQSNRGRKKILIDKEDKEKLVNYFRPHNENFFRLIGKRFDW